MLIACEECHRTVSSDAERCPGCGGVVRSFRRCTDCRIGWADCSRCKGAGKIKGFIFTSECDDCNGMGVDLTQKCFSCAGTSFVST